MGPADMLKKQMSGVRGSGKSSQFLFFSIIFIFALASLMLNTGVNPKAIAASESASVGFIMEMPLRENEKLDAIRYLQARILQPYSNARYLVRNVTVLLPESENEGLFAYLVTLQAGGIGNRAYDLSEFYSVAGYYMVLIKRDGENFDLVDEVQLTPAEIVDRLSLGTPQPPPELTSNPAEFDFTDAVFDATDPELMEWRNRLVNSPTPGWEWVDLTGDGWLDCILDIEGFELKPTSYYTVLVTTSDGFLEGFRSWGYNTLYSEIPTDSGMAIVSDRYSVSSEGDFIQCWRDYYIWNGFRFGTSNGNFPDFYADLVEPLEALLAGALEEETSTSSRWFGIPRFEINATRYAENIGIPSQYYFYLARIAEYQGSESEADQWWQELSDYMNEEYDTQEQVDVEGLDPEVQASLQTYIDWRDELFYAAEASVLD